MPTSHLYATLESPLGHIVLTSNGEALTGLYTSRNSEYTAAQLGHYDPQTLRNAITQLDEYFAGERMGFDLPLAPVGTVFQKLVWAELRKIGYGETKSYGEIARALNMPNASRAIGTANSKNPIGIIVPCHRVISSTGALSGYNGGVHVKEWLLNHEAHFTPHAIRAA